MPGPEENIIKESAFDLDKDQKEFNDYINENEKKGSYKTASNADWIKLNEGNVIAITATDESGKQTNFLMQWKKEYAYKMSDIPENSKMLQDENGAKYHIILPPGTKMEFYFQEGGANKVVTTDEIVSEIKTGKSLDDIWKDEKSADGKASKYDQYKGTESKHLWHNVAAVATATAGVSSFVAQSLAGKSIEARMAVGSSTDNSLAAKIANLNPTVDFDALHSLNQYSLVRGVNWTLSSMDAPVRWASNKIGSGINLFGANKVGNAFLDNSYYINKIEKTGNIYKKLSEKFQSEAAKVSIEEPDNADKIEGLNGKALKMSKLADKQFAKAQEIRTKNVRNSSKSTVQNTNQSTESAKDIKGDQVNEENVVKEEPPVTKQDLGSGANLNTSANPATNTGAVEEKGPGGIKINPENGTGDNSGVFNSAGVNGDNVDRGEVYNEINGIKPVNTHVGDQVITTGHAAPEVHVDSDGIIISGPKVGDYANTTGSPAIAGSGANTAAAVSPLQADGGAPTTGAASGAGGPPQGPGVVSQTPVPGAAGNVALSGGDVPASINDVQVTGASGGPIVNVILVTAGNSAEPTIETETLEQPVQVESHVQVADVTPAITEANNTTVETEATPASLQQQPSKSFGSGALMLGMAAEQWKDIQEREQRGENVSNLEKAGVITTAAVGISSVSGVGVDQALSNGLEEMAPGLGRAGGPLLMAALSAPHIIAAYKSGDTQKIGAATFGTAGAIGFGLAAQAAIPIPGVGFVVGVVAGDACAKIGGDINTAMFNEDPEKREQAVQSLKLRAHDYLFSAGSGLNLVGAATSSVGNAVGALGHGSEYVANKISDLRDYTENLTDKNLPKWAAVPLNGLTAAATYTTEVVFRGVGGLLENTGTGLDKIGQGIEYLGHKVNDGVEWVDNKLGVSKTVSKVANWVDDKLGISRGLNAISNFFSVDQANVQNILRSEDEKKFNTLVNNEVSATAQDFADISIKAKSSSDKYVYVKEVRDLQEKMNERLPEGHKLTVDGKWGIDTTNAAAKLGLLSADDEKIAELEKAAKEKNSAYFKAMNSSKGYVENIKAVCAKSNLILSYAEAKETGIPTKNMINVMYAPEMPRVSTDVYKVLPLEVLREEQSQKDKSSQKPAGSLFDRW